MDDSRAEPRAAALELLAELEKKTPLPGAMRVGLTGAPGSGKSSLLDALVRAVRRNGETLGIVAVDPSSRLSGGALLGDRFRVRAGARDPGVFFRSMAARERLGGVADATRASVTILAAVFDWVIVETVGVGQSESDVAWLVDTLVYVAQPGAGDALQFMKAGVLEHPDLYVVNKADLGPPAERTARELEAALGLAAPGGEPGALAPEPDAPLEGSERTRAPALPGAIPESLPGGRWTARVVRTSAREGTGIDALGEALRAHRRHLEEHGELAARRRRGLERAVLEALERRYGSYGLEKLGGRGALLERVAERPDASFFALVAGIGGEIEDALRKN